MADASPARDPQAVHDAARDVFSRPEFALPQHHWYDQVQQVLSDPVGSLVYAIVWVFAKLPDNGTRSLVAWLVVLALVALVAYLVFRFTRNLTGDAAAAVVFAGTPDSKSAAAWADEASTHEANSNWREAIRARYAALVAGLSEQGVVRARAGMTTGEYVREVEANAPQQAEAFASATGLFEWVWYGEGDAGAEDAARMRRFTGDAGVRVAA